MVKAAQEQVWALDKNHKTDQIGTSHGLPILWHFHSPDQTCSTEAGWCEAKHKGQTFTWDGPGSKPWLPPTSYFF